MKVRMVVAAIGCAVALVLSGCASETNAGDRTREAIGDGTYLNGTTYLRGVNLYTLEQQRDLPSDKVVPDSQESFDYLASRGLKIIRLAVPWQRVIPIPAGETPMQAISGPVDDHYMDIISAEVDEAARAGMRTVIDLHNDCRYPWSDSATPANAISCGKGITESDVTRIWTTLSARFKGDERVAAYDIFNEPKIALTIDVYKRFAQVAVDAIRANGDRHTIWVEGMPSKHGDLPDMAQSGPWIQDPLSAIVYSQHFYLASGKPMADVVDRLRQFGDWCKAWSVRCSVGEVGWSADADEETSEIFDAFYSVADELQMDVTYFGASSRARPNPHWAYTAQGGSDINSTSPQSAVVERHPSK